MLEHFHRVLNGYPEKRAIGYFRKFIVRYARLHPNRKQVTMTLMKAESRAAVEAGINALYTDGEAH